MHNLLRLESLALGEMRLKINYGCSQDSQLHQATKGRNCIMTSQISCRVPVIHFKMLCKTQIKVISDLVATSDL